MNTMIRTLMMRSLWAVFGWGLILLGDWQAGPLRARAADPGPRGVAAKDGNSACCELLLPYLRRGRAPEFVEMVWAVATGSRMGPGDGWFHAGQSRYRWQWLARRHGVKPTERI